MKEKNTTRRGQLIRNWRIKEVSLYIISLLIILLGTILTAKGIFSDPLKKPWQFITGFIICVSGIFSMIDTYHWKYKKYLSKKMKKAR